jgi:hypothetical protein
MGNNFQNFYVIQLPENFYVTTWLFLHLTNYRCVLTAPMCASPAENSHRLEQRQKQVDFGKNTLGYVEYLKRVPKASRRRFVDPDTPDVHSACSKRSWDGRIRVSCIACLRAIVMLTGSGAVFAGVASTFAQV